MRARFDADHAAAAAEVSDLQVPSALQSCVYLTDFAVPIVVQTVMVPCAALCKCAIVHYPP
jgi:hypothetical protein